MIWPFRRAHMPRRAGPASVDWRLGDVAWCVDGAWRIPHRDHPRLGDRLMVSGVFHGMSEDWTEIGFALTFIGKPRAYAAGHFRKAELADDGADRSLSRARSTGAAAI